MRLRFRWRARAARCGALRHGAALLWLVVACSCNATPPTPLPEVDAGADSGAPPIPRAGKPNAALAEQLGAPACSPLDGRGVRLGLWDVQHPRVDHSDLKGRLIERDLAPFGLHATHTAATTLGTGAADPQARGLAPGARAWSFDSVLDTSELAQWAAALSASSHPYGPILGWSRDAACPDRLTWSGGDSLRDPAMGAYDAMAAAIDAIIRDTDLPMLWAAGNERLDRGAAPLEPHYHAGDCDALHVDRHLAERTLYYGTLGGAAAAKNTLTIGAVHVTEHADSTPERIIALGTSSAGPTLDGRVKPELCAGGQTVRSASDSSADDYAILDGSSSATAAAAGAVALLSQLYRQQHAGADMRAAELKALLIATARDAGARGPDPETGFGLIDVEAAIALLAEQPSAEGGSRLQLARIDPEHPVELVTDVVEAATPLRVTAAWIDPPGPPVTTREDPILVDDLDLELLPPSGGAPFRPWSLARGMPGAPAKRDARNSVDPVEVVDVDEADNRERGVWRARVSAASRLRRGRAQVVAIASSVPLRALDATPLLQTPRYVDVALSAPISVAQVVVGTTTGTLPLQVRALDPWLTVRRADATAPGTIEVEIDRAASAPSAERLGRIALRTPDGADSRIVGVVARTVCEPTCDERECGLDPTCGAPCGECAHGEYCGDGGRCNPLGSTCPNAELGSTLGRRLVRVLQGADVSKQSGSCGGHGPETSIAFRAPAAGHYVFTTFGSQVDTVLYARAARCEGAELACSDDAHGSASALELALEAQESVLLWLDSYDTQGRGELALSVERAICPRTQLGARAGTYTLRLTQDEGFDRGGGSCGGSGNHDVWLGWTAPDAGHYRLALHGAADDTVIYIREHDCRGAELGCASAPDRTLDLELSAGQSIAIAIDGSARRRMEVQLEIRSVDQRCGEDCGASRVGCSCDADCVAEGDCCIDACDGCGRCRCQPRCQDRRCGDDGCGGACGACRDADSCVDGQCVEDACAACAACGECAGADCRTLAEGDACEDGDPCTVADRCRAGVCVGAARACSDGRACTSDRCEPASGECSWIEMEECAGPTPASDACERRAR